MKIAIDLNDVIRAYSRTFAKYYNRSQGGILDLNKIELTDNDLYNVFEFNNRDDFNKFLYEDYPYEIFGACQAIDNNTGSVLSNWYGNLSNIDTDEKIEVMIVSTMEYELTIPSTHFFLSKIGSRIRETFFPVDSSEIWNKCDILITANPNLIEMKPENKTVIKIEMPYNENIESDYTYETFEDFVNDKNNFLKIIGCDDTI